MTQRPTHRHLLDLKTLWIVIVLTLVAASCGGEDSATETTTADFVDLQFGEATDAANMSATTLAFATEEPAEFGDEEAPLAPSVDALGSGGTGTEVLQVVDLGRDIIFTAHLTVAVGDVAAAGTEATNAIQALGGFLFGQQTVGGGEARSTLIFKIAPENFQTALAALGEIGEVRTQNISADDVTERVVDLESRIKTADASVERLQALLDNAGDIKTVAELETQLLDRETRLETLRGQLRTLRDAVGLATITLNLTEALSNPAMNVQVTAYPATDDSGASCPGDGGISVLEGESVTVCFEIFNIGDTLLSGFTLRDGVLDLDFEDLNVVWGDPAMNLEPGQSLVLSTEILLERSLRTQSRITAIPVNEDGQRVEAREVVSTLSIFLGAEDPGGLPGFNDGLDRSWDLLKDLGGLIVLAAGLVLPFIWLVALFLLYGWWRRRKYDRPQDVVEANPSAPSPEADSS